MTDQQSNFLELPTGFEGSLMLENGTADWAVKYWQNQHLQSALFQNINHSPLRLVDGSIKINNSNIQLQGLRVFNANTSKTLTINKTVNYPSGQGLIVFNPADDENLITTVALPTSFESLNFAGLALLHCGHYQHTATQTKTFAKVIAPKLHVPLPVGVILPFDGSSWKDNSTLPGFYACVAANVGHGCPNLESRFIRGGTASGVTGGENSTTLTTNQLPAHAHGLDIQIASKVVNVRGADHTHNIDLMINGGNMYAVHKVAQAGHILGAHARHDIPDLAKSSGALSMSGTFQPPGYTGNSGNTGAGASIDNQPSFYQTIFIKKVKNNEIKIEHTA